jgi:hypothetical protein
MFNKIQNPETGNWVNTNGPVGKRVLRNYVRQIGGAGGEAQLAIAAEAEAYAVAIAAGKTPVVARAAAATARVAALWGVANEQGQMRRRVGSRLDQIKLSVETRMGLVTHRTADSKESDKGKMKLLKEVEAGLRADEEFARKGKVEEAALKMELELEECRLIWSALGETALENPLEKPRVLARGLALEALEEATKNNGDHSLGEEDLTRLIMIGKTAAKKSEMGWVFWRWTWWHILHHVEKVKAQSSSLTSTLGFTW